MNGQNAAMPLAFACSTVLIGCAPTGDGTLSIIADSSGVEIVTIQSLPDLDDSGWSWSIDTVRAIPLDRGSQEAPLVYRPQAMTRLPDSTIIINDQADFRLVVLDGQADRAAARFARAGGGSGEIRGFSYLWPGPDRTFWILDFGNARLSRFDVDGTLIVEQPMVRRAGGIAHGKARARPPGLFLQRWFPSPNPEVRAFLDSVVYVDTEGAEYRSLTPLWRQPGPPEQYKTLSPRPVFAPLTRGIIVGTTHNAEFEFFDDDGVLERLIRIPLRARESSAADVPAYLSLLQSVPELRVITPPDIEFYERYPTLHDVLTVDDSIYALSHTAWHHPSVDPTLVFGEMNWRLFDTRGNYRGHVRLPFGFQPFWSGDRWVLGVTTDSAGTQTLLDLRINPPTT
jgi:hypothetical protein